MKKKRNISIQHLVLSFLMMGTINYAQDITTVEAMNQDISDNLDLEAVASIFGDSRDLADFESKLNDPETQISNLDLNEDGRVDYLRVVETADRNAHIIALQAVLGKDIYQDVAIIDVEKDQDGTTRVQVVGDVYLYGPNYIIEPIYIHRPFIVSLFWSSFYRTYHSVYYWGHYPGHFHFWKPFHTPHYNKTVHVHINIKHSYHYKHHRYSTKAVALHTKTRKNDFAKRHPERSHSTRVKVVHRTTITKRTVAMAPTSNVVKKRTTVVRKPNAARRSITVRKSNNKTVKVKKAHQRSTRTKKAAPRAKRTR